MWSSLLLLRKQGKVGAGAHFARKMTFIPIPHPRITSCLKPLCWQRIFLFLPIPFNFFLTNPLHFYLLDPRDFRFPSLPLPGTTSAGGGIPGWKTAESNISDSPPPHKAKLITRTELRHLMSDDPPLRRIRTYLAMINKIYCLCRINCYSVYFHAR